MEMFLTILTLSVLAVVISGVLFLAANRPNPADPLRPDERLLSIPSRFFADDRAPSSSVVPIEVLLLQIERHVRLEQAAAESFRDAPTAEALRMPTTSALRNGAPLEH